MNNKSKLAFDLLSKEMELLDANQQMQTKAGQGIIVSGTGSPTNPFVIKNTIYIDPTGMDSTMYNGIREGILGIMGNSTGRVQMDGCYYMMSTDIQLKTSSNLPESHTGTDNFGNAYSFIDPTVSLNNVGTAAYGVMLGGQDKNINIFGQKINQITDFGTFTKQQLISATAMHEFAHTLGLQDNESGVPIMGQVITEIDPDSPNKKLLAMPGILNEAGLRKMFQSGGVLWGIGVSGGSTGIDYMASTGFANDHGYWRRGKNEDTSYFYAGFYDPGANIYATMGEYDDHGYYHTSDITELYLDLTYNSSFDQYLSTGKYDSDGYYHCGRTDDPSMDWVYNSNYDLNLISSTGNQSTGSTGTF